MKLRWRASMPSRMSMSILFGVLLFLTVSSAAATDVVDIYQQDVPQMTTLECAKCHLQIFESLRDAGGLHQQQCRDCHERFHTFTPGVPWEERVPACSTCHDFPHGEEISTCLQCHTNAHAPIESMVGAEKLFDLCQRCHPEAQQQLAEQPSAHSSQTCIDCHSGARHGQRPDCSSCHAETHAPFVDNVGCVACHAAHAPNSIRYDSQVPNAICAGCHAEQLQGLQDSTRKHTLLACVNCHADEHGLILSCQQCHGSGPHNPTLLENFSSCGECHGDAHKLKL